MRPEALTGVRALELAEEAIRGEARIYELGVSAAALRRAADLFGLAERLRLRRLALRAIEAEPTPLTVDDVADVIPFGPRTARRSSVPRGTMVAGARGGR